MGERWTKQNMYGFLTVLDYNSFCKYVLSIKSQSDLKLFEDTWAEDF